MCRSCENDPYLAGLLVLFQPRRQAIPVTELGEDGISRTRWLEPDRPRAYPGRCVGHHKGWVRVRSGGALLSMPEDRVIAYEPPASADTV